MTCGNAAKLRERITHLKDFLGAPESDGATSVSVQMEQHAMQNAGLLMAFDSHVTNTDAKTSSPSQTLSKQI